jgi:Putative Actinobacterial Holin-X, holin superfamily III
MAHEAASRGWRAPQLTRTLADVFGDFSDLMQKEIRLARAEISETIAGGLQAGISFVLAGMLGFTAFLALIEAGVFALSAYAHLALHWSCLIVAGILAAAAGVAFAFGRSRKLAPDRSIKQITNDVSAVKEQLR